MDKLNFETPDMVSGNIEKIAALFPSVITEMRGEDGQVKKGVNFEVLKQLLSRDVVDGDECYEFTWVGKKAALAEAARADKKRTGGDITLVIPKKIGVCELKKVPVAELLPIIRAGLEG